MITRLSTLALAATAALAATPAFAAFPNDCSVNDTFVAATACAGVYTSNNGNNLGAGNTTIADLDAAFGVLGWSLSVGELVADEATTGLITLNPAVSGPFAIAIKSGSARSGGGYNLYFYDASVTNVSSLEFFSTPAGKELSHASLYTAAIPEPGTYALLIAGLGAVGFVARRRKSV